MKKSLIIVGSIAIIAMIAVIINFNTTGLEGQFARRDAVNVRANERNERIVPESRDLTRLKYSDLNAYIPPEPKYVTLADLVTEITYRKLNLMSGWGENKKKMPDLDLSKATSQKIMDCDTGLVDGKFELGEWQYCYLKKYASISPTPAKLQEKITRGQAAVKIYQAFVLENGYSYDYKNAIQLMATDNLGYENIYKDVTPKTGSETFMTYKDAEIFYYDSLNHPILQRAAIIVFGTYGIFDVEGWKKLNFRPNDYLTENEAKIWFKNLNSLYLKGGQLWNPWNYLGDIADPSSKENVPKAY